MMNSTVSDDLSRVHLAREATKCLKNISKNTQNLTVLHKELLEINLSVTTYIEESKRRIDSVRSQLAHDAKSSQRVVEVLSDKLLFILQKNMSKLPRTPKKHSKLRHITNVSLTDKNPKNTSLRLSQQQNANTFVTWYRNMIDNERQSFSLYLSDDATLEWFGKTIKTRRKISTFLNHDMQCSRHHFATVEIIEKFPPRSERFQRRDDTILASPLNSPELLRSKPGKRKHSQTSSISPKWAEGCQPDEVGDNIARKRFKIDHTDVHGESNLVCRNNDVNNTMPGGNEMNDNGDGAKEKSKALVTPPNVEIGQGDCLPSTSGTDSDRSHEALNAQLPKLAVECNGYIEVTRSKNSCSVDSMKWERKCKVHISYSDDPLNLGEYIIWAIRYHDENKCRRNLMDAFEKVA